MGESPLTPTRKDGNFWRKQIQEAVSVREAHEPWWEANLKAYAPLITSDPRAFGDSINTNRDFTLVERKKADLFYQRPDVSLQPSPLMDGPIVVNGQPFMRPGAVAQPGQPPPTVPQTEALASHETITNEKLGPDGIDAAALMDAVLFDVEVFGLGATKMGYESVTQPAPDPRDPTGQASIGVPVYERLFWEDLSLKQLLIPKDFRRSGQYDKAPWLGHRFELPLTEGNRQRFKLPADFQGSKTDKPQHFDHGPDTNSGDQMFSGTEVWYRSALYRSDVVHPEHLTQLVLVDGVDEPVIDQDSPYQTVTQTGGLTPDSLIGFPIHIFTLRVIRDSAYPPADCTLIRPLVNELNLFRGQMVQYRDAQTLRWMYNVETLPTDALAKIVRAPIGGMIGVPGEAFAGEGCIKELPHGSMPRESFTSNDYIDNDIARTTAIDASGAGVQSTGSTTATEQQIIASNANARLDKERGLALKGYCKGVTKFSTLLLRLLPVEQAAQIVGPQAAQIWDVWRKSGVNAALAFTALPDSALRTDQAVDRKQSQDLYSFLANDPYIQKGRAKLLEKLLRKFHIDPNGIVQPPDPAKPEPDKISISIKGDDLNPFAPQYSNIYALLSARGEKLAPPAVDPATAMLMQSAAQQKPNTEHGGKLAQQESLSKHAADQTGGMQGTGMPAAMGAPGGMVS